MTERANRTRVDIARTLLIDGKVPIQFWAEAVSTAAYIHNVTPKRQKEVTPMEIWSGISKTPQKIWMQNIL